MPQRATRVALAILLACVAASPADAARKGKAVKGKAPPHPTQSLSKKKRKVVKKYKKAMKRWRRHRAKSFEEIAAGNYKGRHVLYRTKRATAFLDWGDPQHPTFDPKRMVGEWDLISEIPVDRRAHVLVIPNQKREHLTPKMGDKIRADDLSHAEDLLREAESVAKELGIHNANIFINPSESYSVGYLHVHIIGERSKPYPSPLPSPGS